MNTSAKLKPIKWRGSKAREILLNDLENKIVPLDDDDFPAAEAWSTLYCDTDEFKEVPYEQFERQLKAHRKQVQKRWDEATEDGARYMNFRLEFPAPATFRGSPTHILLREDVKEEMERGEGYAMPVDIFRSLRPEYQAMGTSEFGQRLWQERRYRKFCNHLEAKRSAINFYVEPGEKDSEDEEEDEVDVRQSHVAKRHRRA